MDNPLKSRRLKRFRPPVPGNIAEFWTKAMIYYYCYNTFIVIVGSSFIIWGCWMIIHGIQGKIDWILKIFGNENTIYNATPGIFLVIVGLLIILLARSDIEYKSK